MEKIRVPKGERLWFIDYFGDITHIYEDYGAFITNLYDCGNYFATKEEAEAMAKKLRAVLKGAEVYILNEITEIRANAFADGMEAERRKLKIVK